MNCIEMNKKNKKKQSSKMPLASRFELCQIGKFKYTCEDYN